MRAIPLKEATDVSEVGGKAARLGRAAASGLDVPPGVVLLPRVAETVAREKGSAIALAGTVFEGLGGALAIRSSAPEEDSRQASFAGQYESVLGVATIPAFIEAVQRVLRSASSKSVAAYRRRRGVLYSTKMAVICQRLIPVEVAGVAFTRHPVTHADQIVIEASWGLGEAVVAGLVNPDQYVLDPSGSVTSTHIGRKDRARVSSSSGDIVEVPVDGDRVYRPCLGEAEIAKLFSLATACQKLFGGESQDLEWGLAGGQLWLLQCRPVVTGGLVQC